MQTFLHFRLRTKLKTVGITEPTAVTVDIAEPVRFSDLKFGGEANADYHGFDWGYGDGLKLDFTCESAHELLSEQYYTFGTDAAVDFLLIETDRKGEESIETFRLDFETISIQPGRVSVEVMEQSIKQKILDRFDTPVALDVTTTLDKTDIVPPSPYSLALPGQTLHEMGELKRQGRYTKTDTFVSPGLGGLYAVLPNMLQTQTELNALPAPGALPALTTLSGVNTLPGFVAQSPLQAYPLIKLDTAGVYSVGIDWLFRVNVSMTKGALQLGKAKFGRLRMKPVVQIQKPGESIVITTVAPEQNSDGFATSAEHQFSATYRGELNLPAGATVAVGCIVACFAERPLKQLDFTVTTLNLRIKIDRKTRAEPTRADVFSLPDALRHVVGVIAQNTPVTGELVSRQAGNPNQATDGYATEYAVTSGGLLRGLAKAPTFTAKELMATLHAHHWAGILYQRDEPAGAESLRVEAGPWFYRGGEILRIEEVFAYREEPDLDLLFNQIEVGYETFPDSGPGVAEEFNTSRTYQTPLVSRDAKLDIRCPLIAAGTAIEQARKLALKQVDENGQVVTNTEAGPYDDNGFLLHVMLKPTVYNDTVTFAVRPARPFPGKPYTAHYLSFGTGVINRLLNGVQLGVGDVITFLGTGTANDGKAYKIRGVSNARLTGGPVNLNPVYEIENTVPMVSAGPVVCTWQVVKTGPKLPGLIRKQQPLELATLRTNQRLDVTGITDPESAYNLELSPARMLRRHAPFINSGLAYKQAIDELVCTAYKHNGQMATQARPEIAPLPGDSDKQYIAEVGNVTLGANERFERLFTPELVYITAPLSREDLALVVSALRNQGADDKRMGYVTVINPDGDEVSGYLRRIRYDRGSEVAELTLRKRRTDEGPNGPACRDYTDWKFGRFETDPSANPNLYRFCRFSDFQ